MSQQLLSITNFTLVDGWDNEYRFTGANLITMQLNEDRDVDWSLDGGATYFKIKAGTTFPISSFNVDNAGGSVRLYFRGTTGDHVQIAEQKMP